MDLSKNVFANMCYIKENNVVLNYIFFKLIAKEQKYNGILDYITNNIDKVLLKYPEFIVHVDMKNLTIVEIDKHKEYIKFVSEIFKNKYPRKLEKCYVYNAPFIFTQILHTVSMFIDKETQKKIILVKR